MAKKPTAAKPSAAVVLLKSIIGALATAIEQDEAVAKMAEEEFGLVLANAAGGEEELDEDEEFDDDEEEEEAPRGKKGAGKNAPAKAPAKAAGKGGKKKAPSVEELADSVSDGDLSVLDTVDDDVLLAVAKALKAPRSALKSADAAIGWVEENFAPEEEEGEEEDGFDVDNADEDELMAFALENKIGTRSRLSKLDEDELRQTVADWLEEQEGEDEEEDEDEDGFDEDDFDDEEDEEFDDEI